VSDERDRRLLSNLVSRAVKRIHNASVDKYEEATQAHVTHAVRAERLMLASWASGVLSELNGNLPRPTVEQYKARAEAAYKVQTAILQGDYRAANEAMTASIEAYVTESIEQKSKDKEGTEP